MIENIDKLTDNQILEVIRTLALYRLDVFEAEKILLGTKLLDLDPFDGFDILALLIDVEKIFQIEITDAQAAKMFTVADIITHIKTCKNW